MLVMSGKSASALTVGTNIDSILMPLLNLDLPHLTAMLNKADVVIEVLNMWDLLTHHSSTLEVCIVSKGGQQKLLLVLNQIGVCALTTGTNALYIRVIADGTTNL